MGKVKISKKEFKGNVLVRVTDQEVRIWVCNEEGENIFRLKALGKVSEGTKDVIVIGSRWGKE